MARVQSKNKLTSMQQAGFDLVSHWFVEEGELVSSRIFHKRLVKLSLITNPSNIWRPLVNKGYLEKSVIDGTPYYCRGPNFFSSKRSEKDNAAEILLDFSQRRAVEEEIDICSISADESEDSATTSPTPKRL